MENQRTTGLVSVWPNLKVKLHCLAVKRIWLFECLYSSSITWSI